MSCASITNTATQIWNDLGQPSSISVSYIQSRLVSDPYIGKLNALTQICFSGISGYIDPELSPDEQAIYATIYERDYYTTKLNQTLDGTDISWVSMAEGDSRIVRVSAVDQARVYRDMQKQLNDQLNYLVSAYRTNQMQTRSVEFVSYINGRMNSYP